MKLFTDQNMFLYFIIALIITNIELYRADKRADRLEHKVKLIEDSYVTMDTFHTIGGVYFDAVKEFREEFRENRNKLEECEE